MCINVKNRLIDFFFCVRLLNASLFVNFALYFTGLYYLNNIIYNFWY